MSDEEDVVVSGEEEEEAPVEDSGPSEAEKAMQKRRQQMQAQGLDEDYMEILEQARVEREREEEEITQLREKRERRKREREQEEKEMAIKRTEEEQRRKAAEEERRRKKDEEEQTKKAARASKMAEFEKWKQPAQPNFVIEKRGGMDLVSSEEGNEGPVEDKKSKEQLEAEKKAILAQRIEPLEISGFDSSKLGEKAKELHKMIFRAMCEKYDLEKRFKEQQYDMMELAERARNMNKVGKGGLKRVLLGPDEVDKFQDRFAGAPAKVEMFSKFERQYDKRSYDQRNKVFHGPTFIEPSARITPCRLVKWNEGSGLPEYEDIPGAERPDDEDY